MTAYVMTDVKLVLSCCTVLYFLFTQKMHCSTRGTVKYRPAVLELIAVKNSILACDLSIYDDAAPTTNRRENETMDRDLVRARV